MLGVQSCGTIIHLPWALPRGADHSHPGHQASTKA